jgi:hypothetical protein
MLPRSLLVNTVGLAMFLGLAIPVDAQESEAELAKKLQNPVANLISVPFQSNWDFGNGRNAMRYTLNVQPVVPFSLTEEWNLIIRTIVPFIHAEATVPGGDSHGGTGDIVQSFFISPAAPVAGWTIGAGPVMLYPTASDNALGSEKWGMGPTAVVLRQDRGWTYGLLVNHLESFAGTSSRERVSATFMQPFLTYTTKTFTSFGINTESTYDWQHEQWTVPISVSVSQLLKIAGQPIQFSLGGRYYAERPVGGPDWGIRFAVTLLFPKR